MNTFMTFFFLQLHPDGGEKKERWQQIPRKGGKGTLWSPESAGFFSIALFLSPMFSSKLGHLCLF